MPNEHPLRALPDHELLQRLAELLRGSRRTEADLVAHIGEADVRKLYLKEASPSMFAYCTEVLHLSEAEAYLRITAARAARRHPLLLAMLADGRLHLSGVARLAAHLTPEGGEELLKRAAHKSKRQILELLAHFDPRPDAPTVIRKLPERQLCPDRVADPAPSPPLPPLLLPTSLVPHALESSTPKGMVEPLSPARYKVQFTASAELCRKLERLKELMPSGSPNGDLAAIIEQAVTEKLERLEARRFALTKVPRSDLAQADPEPYSRHLPAAIRRAVRERNGEKCGYVGATGRRCSGTGLEYHHRHPFGRGGDHRPDNLNLLCRGHNLFLAVQDYGEQTMARHTGRRPVPDPPPR